MNLINQNLIDTMTTRQNEFTNMPKWARDERLYNCDPPDRTESYADRKMKQLDKLLFWWAIVNLY
jgi:hypothetical protein